MDTIIVVNNINQYGIYNRYTYCNIHKTVFWRLKILKNKYYEHRALRRRSLKKPYGFVTSHN